VWRKRGGYLLFSDIPKNTINRYKDGDSIRVFLRPAGYTGPTPQGRELGSNGLAFDANDRLVMADHGNRQIARVNDSLATKTALADRYDGKRLNSPNDVVERSDGSVWFTDPSYGIDSDYEGHQAKSEIGADQVYRIDPGTAEVRLVADDFNRPNGLAFSQDERQLYITDSEESHIRLFDVADDSTLTGGTVFARCDAGAFDGVRLDDTGRIWAAAHDGIHCFDPDGTLLGKLRVPETVANFTFGGPQRNHLFICATSSLYSLRVNFNGARYPR